ncbi:MULTISPECIES: hypothetical protein [Saccharothrix]|uniref:hypothetical protein n=1 Tax=Saccharothrix TaxID=2071 RepID=UPI00093D0607|nr:hypothetical protein [Saccharothrix sp. CB00851]OKI30456.1 hypothetical protein A6A25_28380 [Saccharothrix sp. CB00851]
MTRTDPNLVAEIDAIEDAVVDETVDTDQTSVDLVDVGGLEPTGGPYKPTTDDPEVERLVKPMGGPYKPTGDPETNGGPYKPTTDEPAAVTQTK